MANKKIIQHIIYVSKNYSETEREMIGEKAIELILKRTAKGLDEKSKPFKKYSPEWAKEKGSHHVDLKYTGDMLSELTIVSAEESGKVVIGYEGSSEVAGQAEGNITGIRGRSKKIVNPRPFLGITQKEKDWILANVDQSSVGREQAKTSFLDQLIKNIVRSQGTGLKDFEDE